MLNHQLSPFRRLERRVFLVAIAGLLPIAILTCATLVYSALEQKERLLSAYEQTMLAVVTAADSELRSTLAALQAFATRPSLSAADFEALHQEAGLLLAQQPSWRNVVVSTPEAQQVMNALQPFGEPLPGRVAPEAVRATATTRRPTIGDVRLNPLTGRQSVAVQVPYVANGVTRYVLTAVVRPEAFLPLLEQQSLPPEGVSGLFDRHLHIVTRSLDADRWVGRPPVGGLRELMRGDATSGWSKATTPEGVPVYAVFHRSAFSGWSAAVGIPRALIDAPLIRSWVTLGAAVALSVLLGLSAAFFAGRTLVRPIRELEKAAARVGGGERPAVPATDLPEIAAVGVALAGAHAEREELFAREREARIAAENASKAKDEFVAMLGHELRNPLAAITNAAVLVSRQAGAASPELATASQIIQRQSKHLARLTDDLLDAGRVILGKIALDRVPLDLASVVTMVIDAFRSAGGLAAHDFAADLAPVWVEGDATRIEQVVTNVLANAVRYTPPGGRIAVRLKPVAGRAVLEVEDSGVGIAPELLPRIFDVFVQGERSIDRAQGGLGIGLTLVRRLVELHGGTVCAHSAGPGQGSRFVVALPAITPAGAAVRVAAPERGRPTRIAIVEDNDDLRRSLRALLELDGHTVLEATDGPSGLELLLQQPEAPELALVDIGLPGLDGCELVCQLRLQRGRSIYCVAMSGYGGEADRARGLAAGFDEYLVKPVDPTAIQAILARRPQRDPRPVSWSGGQS